MSDQERIEKLEAEVFTLNKRLLEVSSILKETLQTLIDQNTGYMEIIKRYRESAE